MISKGRESFHPGKGHMYVQTLLERVHLLQGTQTFHFLTRHDELQATPKSQDSHVSNFIGSDQKVAPYLLVGF